MGRWTSRAREKLYTYIIYVGCAGGRGMRDSVGGGRWAAYRQ